MWIFSPRLWLKIHFHNIRYKLLVKGDSNSESRVNSLTTRELQIPAITRYKLLKEKFAIPKRYIKALGLVILCIRRIKLRKQKSDREDNLKIALLFCTWSVEVGIWLVSQTHIPVRGSNIPCNDGLLGCVGSDPERESLTLQGCKSLVWSSPVMAHLNPPRSGSLHPHVLDVTSSSHIHHIDQEPVPISLERESETPSPYAWYPERKTTG